ncbi:MAG TPA: PPOX class F420-dependent oxidoreductase [Acidimicrobiales bacterium]|jgi:PPOX class probable F420-dependent enzyme|nr:PPOX class F420-dependent oxidoreductase [Acidimicrobiales bacterium]
MGLLLEDAFTFVRRRNQGVLVTLRRNGRPQLSNIIYAPGPDHSVRISVTESRAKTRNLRRDPRASLYVSGDNFFAYVVLEGEVTLTDVARDPDDPVVDELIEVYRALQGEHPDWGDYRRAMVSEGRLVARLSASYAYGISGA